MTGTPKVVASSAAKVAEDRRRTRRLARLAQQSCRKTPNIV
jgi:hypothetical protein